MNPKDLKPGILCRHTLCDGDREGTFYVSNKPHVVGRNYDPEVKYTRIERGVIFTVISVKNYAILADDGAPCVEGHDILILSPSIFGYLTLGDNLIEAHVELVADI